jgi:hypothetical protein
VASFDEVVPPGKAGSIKASVHTASYKGPIGKQVTVTHDDASQGPIQLNVTANIVGSVEVLPFPALQLARRRRGFTAPALLIVRKDVTEQGELAFGGLAASVPWIKVSSRKVAAEEPAVEGLPAAKPGDVVLSVLANADAPVGNHSENISFTTGLTREPKVIVPVTVYVQAAITVQPAELILTPAADSPTAANGQVLAALRDDVDLKSVTAESASSAFTVKVDPSGAQAFRLLVDWKGEGKHPATDSIIHVRAGKESIDLPVKVVTAKAAQAP